MGRENEMKRLEKEHKEKLDDLEEYEKKKRDPRGQNRTVKRAVNGENAVHKHESCTNREEIERVKESAKKDIDRANANVIEKEEECEAGVRDCRVEKRATPLEPCEAQLENLQTITRDFCKRKRRRQ